MLEENKYSDINVRPKNLVLRLLPELKNVAAHVEGYAEGSESANQTFFHKM